MKQNILKKLENYPYYKILKIPNQKEKELKTKFLIYATKLGKIRSQNNDKDKIIEIKPNIKKIKNLKKKRKKIKTVLRYHQTNLGGSIHSDGPQLDKPPKYIIMACENNTLSGGDTILVNTKKIYNFLLKKNRKYLKVLEKNFFFERRGFKYKNKNVFFKPIFKKNNFLFRYLRDYIEKGFIIKNQRITFEQKCAMNLFRSTINIE